MNRDETQIYEILIAFGSHALPDIQFMSNHKKPNAGFILGARFIDQLSSYRYNDSSDYSYQKFIEEYLPIYQDLKLQKRLRHILIHNYSISKELALSSDLPDLHLKTLGIATVINLSNFVSDLNGAFGTYKKQVQTDGVVRENAFKWAQRHKIIKMSRV